LIPPLLLFENFLENCRDVLRSARGSRSRFQMVNGENLHISIALAPLTVRLSKCHICTLNCTLSAIIDDNFSFLVFLKFSRIKRHRKAQKGHPARPSHFTS